MERYEKVMDSRRCVLPFKNDMVEIPDGLVGREGVARSMLEL